MSAEAPAPEPGRRLGALSLLLFGLIGIGLGLLQQRVEHIHAKVVFRGYMAGLLLLGGYRLLARLPVLRRRLRPTRLTGEGLQFVILTVLFGAAAIYTGDNLLYLVVSVLLALLLISGALAGLNLGGVRVALPEREPPRLVAGQRGGVPLVVDNRKWIPSWALEVELRARDARGQPLVGHAFAAAPARARVEASAFASPPRRGPLQVHELRLLCRFPFGFLERDRLLAVSRELLVLPASAPLRDPAALSVPRGEGPRRSRRIAPDGEDLAGLREYREGDPPRWIHWRSTARAGKPIVRLQHARHQPQTLLIVDSRALDDERDARADAHREGMFRLAASLIVHLLQRGQRVGLRLPDRELSASQRLGGARLLEALARESRPRRSIRESLRLRPPDPADSWITLAPERADAEGLAASLGGRALAIAGADEAVWLAAEGGA